MATIYDVAKAAGVSPATVSFVLNGGPRPVSAATKARVIAAIDALQFQPNAAARNLARGRLGQIGVCFASVGHDIISNNYAAMLVDGALEAAALHEFDVILLTQRPSFAEAFHRKRMDGALIITPPKTLDLNALATDFPFVTIAAPPPGEGDRYINFDIDNVAGIQQAVAHLVSLGHARIGHITGSLDQFDGMMRYEAFLQATAQFGIDHAPVATGSFMQYERQANLDASHFLLTLPNRPTALVCANDAIARVAQEVAEGLGLSVPRDLSLVGFDDSPLSILSSPFLTSVRQPLRELASDAVVRLLRWVNNQESNSANYLAIPELIVRDSTAPPPR